MRRGAAYGTQALATPLSEEHDAWSHGRRVQTGAFMTFAFRLAVGRVCGVRRGGRRAGARCVRCTRNKNTGGSRDTHGTRDNGHTDHSDEPHNHPDPHHLSVVRNPDFIYILQTGAQPGLHTSKSGLRSYK